MYQFCFVSVVNYFEKLTIESHCKKSASYKHTLTTGGDKVDYRTVDVYSNIQRRSETHASCNSDAYSISRPIITALLSTLYICLTVGRLVGGHLPSLAGETTATAAATLPRPWTDGDSARRPHGAQQPAAVVDTDVQQISSGRPRRRPTPTAEKNNNAAADELSAISGGHDRGRRKQFTRSNNPWVAQTRTVNVIYPVTRFSEYGTEHNNEMKSPIIATGTPTCTVQYHQDTSAQNKSSASERKKFWWRPFIRQ